MIEHAWVKEFPGTVIVCDRDGRIVEMNEKAVAAYAGDGGAALVGKSLLDCHPEPARTQVRGLLEEARANVYTIEKRGVRKLIYQSPWYRDGAHAGLVELSLELPAEMPHVVRDGR